MLDWLFHPVGDSKPYWMELLPSLLTVLIAAFGYWWGFKIWRKQKHEELRIAANQQRETARIAACKAVWGLLSYLSEKENEDTVFVKRGTADNVTWHLRRAQGVQYIKTLAQVFFEQGHGIFMPKDIRDGVYEFRSRVFRILEKDMRSSGDMENDMILVNNLEVISKVQELRDLLNKRLRQEVLMD